MDLLSTFDKVLRCVPSIRCNFEDCARALSNATGITEIQDELVPQLSELCHLCCAVRLLVSGVQSAATA